MKMRPDRRLQQHAHHAHNMSFQVTTLSGIRRKISPGGGDCIGGNPDKQSRTRPVSFLLLFGIRTWSPTLSWVWTGPGPQNRTPGSKEGPGRARYYQRLLSTVSGLILRCNNVTSVSGKEVSWCKSSPRRPSPLRGTSFVGCTGTRRSAETSARPRAGGSPYGPSERQGVRASAPC